MSVQLRPNSSHAGDGINEMPICPQKSAKCPQRGSRPGFNRSSYKGVNQRDFMFWKQSLIFCENDLKLFLSSLSETMQIHKEIILHRHFDKKFEFGHVQWLLILANPVARLKVKQRWLPNLCRLIDPVSRKTLFFDFCVFLYLFDLCLFIVCVFLQVV